MVTGVDEQLPETRLIVAWRRSSIFPDPIDHRINQ